MVTCGVMTMDFEFIWCINLFRIINSLLLVREKCQAELDGGWHVIRSLHSTPIISFMWYILLVCRRRWVAVTNASNIFKRRLLTNEKGGCVDVFCQRTVDQKTTTAIDKVQRFSIGHLARSVTAKDRRDSSCLMDVRTWRVADFARTYAIKKGRESLSCWTRWTTLKTSWNGSLGQRTSTFSGNDATQRWRRWIISYWRWDQSLILRMLKNIRNRWLIECLVEWRPTCRRHRIGRYGDAPKWCTFLDILSLWQTIRHALVDRISSYFCDASLGHRSMIVHGILVMWLNC